MKSKPELGIEPLIRAFASKHFSHLAILAPLLFHAYPVNAFIYKLSLIYSFLIMLQPTYSLNLLILSPLSSIRFPMEFNKNFFPFLPHLRLLLIKLVTKIYRHAILAELGCILDLEPSKTRDRALSFSRKADFMRLPVAFLTNGIFIVKHGGIELTSACYESACLTTTPH